MVLDVDGRPAAARDALTIEKGHPLDGAAGRWNSDHMTQARAVAVKAFDDDTA